MKKSMLKIYNLNLNNGIFQGDGLTLLLFCIALISLSTELKNTDYRYKTIYSTGTI